MGGLWWEIGDKGIEGEYVARKVIGSTEFQNKKRVQRSEYRKFWAFELIREIILKMKLLYVFEERAPIFIELAWGISLSSASRLLAATILAGALAGSAMAQAPDAGCALPSEPEGIPAAIDAAITGPMDKGRPA